jgi:hypothetical protein
MEVSLLIQQSKPLIELWKALVGDEKDFVPTQRQFLIWLSMYDVATVEKGISRTAVWQESTQDLGKAISRTISDYVRYASSVMATAKRDAAAKAVSRG